MTEEQNGPERSAAGLAVQLSRLPAQKRRVALEMSASLAGVSLRVSREFVDAVPAAAKILSAADIRNWAEMGRKLAMGNVGSGVEFFAAGAEWLRNVPKDSRPLVFQIAARQLVLSSSIAISTFEFLPVLAAELNDPPLLTDVLALAAEIAPRSARHSAEFLERTPAVAAALRQFGDDEPIVRRALFNLGTLFSSRTGGMTADLWAQQPATLDALSAPNAVRLLETALEVLELGGSVTLHFLRSGNSVLGEIEEIFEKWYTVFRSVSTHGNAVVIGFLRSTPRWVRQLKAIKGREEAAVIAGAVLDVVSEIANIDGEAALAAFRSSSQALSLVSTAQFEAWAAKGLAELSSEPAKARRSYFALETRQSNTFLRSEESGLQLDSIRSILRMYVEGLTGREVEVVPMTAVEQGSRIGNGSAIHLPAAITVFDDESENFRLYKVLAAYGAGQIEFGTFEQDSPGLKAAFAELSLRFSAGAEEIDAFSLSGYLEDVQKADRSRPDLAAPSQTKLSKGSDYQEVLKLFPEPQLARRIFGAIENKRIDELLRRQYRGLRKDLDLMRKTLAARRPFIFDLPLHQVPSELLFQITLCGGPTEDAQRFYGQIASEIGSVIDEFLLIEQPGVGDSLIAASLIYTLFQNIDPDRTAEAETETGNEEGEEVYSDREAAEAVTDDKIKREPAEKKGKDIGELFNAWNETDENADPDDLQGAEKWLGNEIPEHELDAGEEAFAYDEWDRELHDYRVGWSRVIEKKVKKGDRTFVELTRSRYRGIISSIRHQFQLMKPENLTRINREIDGEDYDLNALVDLIIDRRADGRQSENIYTKRLRKQRDVAVSILLDQSSSTARTITRNPLQPYTFPGRRIIEIEKEGLVLMSEALEAVGDLYSIYGFTSEGRRNVKFYIVKDFGEKYSAEVERRIGGITFENNTRLGAAIRHAAAKLLRQESRTKLLIILTDGRPYDHDYGDARYAREDVREALNEVRLAGMIPFCITIDRESEAELKDLYGDVGYTIIDDVLSLPERMPNIYRRLTS